MTTDASLPGERADPGPMLSHVVELYRYRDLLWTWTLREIRVRYKQSFFGVAWAILQPLALMLMFTAVFSFLAKIPTDGIPYPLFSYTGVLPWTLLHTSIGFGVPSLVTNMTLVTKTYFPREILPMGALGAAFVDYVVATSIFLLLMLGYRVPVTWNVLWVPLILIPQIMLTLGIAFLGSSLTVFYRDIRFVIPLGLQLWFYATPILYPVSLVPERLQTLYMLNPMAVIIDSYRTVLLNGTAPSQLHLLYATVVSLLALVLGYRVFKRLELRFADLI